MQQQIYVFFHLDQVRVDRRRLSHYVKQRDRRTGPPSYRAGELDRAIDVFRAAAAYQYSLERFAIAYYDQHRRPDSLDYFVSFRGHEKWAARAFSYGADHHQIIVCLVGAFDYFLDGLASLGDDLGVNASPFEHLLRPAKRLKHRVFLAWPLRYSENGHLGSGFFGNHPPEANCVFRKIRSRGDHSRYNGEA